MNDVNHIVTENDIKKIFTGSLIHIVAVSITYLSATFLYSIIQDGLGDASKRLAMTSDIISSNHRAVGM